MQLSRRDAIASALAAFTTSSLIGRGATAGEASALYVPSYDAAVYGSDPHATRALPAGYDGPTTAVTRIGLADSAVASAVFPVQGHVIAIDQPNRRGVLHSQSRDWFVVFDADTLDLSAVSAPFADGFVGGGHARYAADDALLTVERAPYGPYLGAPEKHFGRVSIRDPDTLRVIGRVSSHGLAPHDFSLTDDGRTLVVANYGSPAPRTCAVGPPPRTEAPSVAFIDLTSGKLLDRFETRPGTPEIRHVAVASRDDLLAIRVDQGEPSQLSDALGVSENDAAKDETAVGGCAYLPAPAMGLTAGKGSLTTGAPLGSLRQGLSVAYDPAHDRYLATYPSSHAIHVIDRRSLQTERVIDAAALGLRYPCGLALDPVRNRYFVAGAFGPIMAFSLETHAPLPDATINVGLHRHSHIALA